MLGGTFVTGGVGANDVVVAVVDVMGAAEVGATRVCGFFVVAGVVGGDGGVGVGGKGDASKISTVSKMETVFPWHERLKEFERKHRLKQQQRTIVETARKQRQSL
jgi:hypothetical protein